MTGSGPPQLDYASADASRPTRTAALVVGISASLFGLFMALYFTGCALDLHAREKTDYNARGMIRFGVCAVLAGVPSLWFLIVGHRSVEPANAPVDADG